MTNLHKFVTRIKMSLTVVFSFPDVSTMLKYYASVLYSSTYSVTILCLFSPGHSRDAVAAPC